jgi:hypothetical protein
MPIRPEQRRLYPADWRQISNRIRFQRAGGRCEWPGCQARHGEPHPITGSRVVLTCAHLNHNPSDCADGNLLALCQLHHLAYDAEHHRQTRRDRRAVGDLLAGLAA